MVQLFLACLFLTTATAFPLTRPAGGPRHRCRPLASSFDDRPALSEIARDRITDMVNAKTVVVFMKGTPLFPQCGFSDTVVKILSTLPGLDYDAHDVLADDQLRSSIKLFSDWPTIPQLYIAGEFVGGSAIVLELFQTGELQEMIEVAAAS